MPGSRDNPGSLWRLALTQPMTQRSGGRGPRRDPVRSLLVLSMSRAVQCISIVGRTVVYSEASTGHTPTSAKQSIRRHKGSSASGTKSHKGMV